MLKFIMISYELAKKLKDAGWTERNLMVEKGGNKITNHPKLLKQEYYDQCSLCGDGAVGLCEVCVIRSTTTLSELIEACQSITEDVICIGTVFKDSPFYNDTPWHSATYKKDYEFTESGYTPPETTASVHGKTIEESVANLWLKLNNKQ